MNKSANSNQNEILNKLRKQTVRTITYSLVSGPKQGRAKTSSVSEEKSEVNCKLQEQRRPELGDQPWRGKTRTHWSFRCLYLWMKSWKEPLQKPPPQSLPASFSHTSSGVADASPLEAFWCSFPLILVNGPPDEEKHPSFSSDFFNWVFTF